jgi:hypothetical protein
MRFAIVLSARLTRGPLRHRSHERHLDRAEEMGCGFEALQSRRMGLGTRIVNRLEVVGMIEIQLVVLEPPECSTAAVESLGIRRHSCSLAHLNRLV